MHIHQIDLTATLTDAFIGMGCREVPGYIGIPGIADDRDVTLYVRAQVLVHSATVVADGVTFRMESDARAPCQWGLSAQVAESGGSVEAAVV